MHAPAQEMLLMHSESMAKINVLLNSILWSASKTGVT